MTQSIGHDALEGAFIDIVDCVKQGVTLGLPLELLEVPEFSYLMTPKQLDGVRKYCRQKGIAAPKRRDIHITGVLIKHVIESRSNKDSLSNGEIAQLLFYAFNKGAVIADNRKYGNQAIIFNAQKVLRIQGQVFNAAAIIKVENENGDQGSIVPITAYHATERKVRGFKII